MSLYRLTYISRPSQKTGTTGKPLAKQIAAECREHNAQRGLSMVLLHVDDFYIQIIEGARHEISPTLKRIFADSRHDDIQIIESHPITRRVFESKEAIHFDMNSKNNSLFRAYTVGRAFDPYDLSPEALNDFVQDIIRKVEAQGHKQKKAA